MSAVVRLQISRRRVVTETISKSPSKSDPLLQDGFSFEEHEDRNPRPPVSPARGPIHLTVGDTHYADTTDPTVQWKHQ